LLLLAYFSVGAGEMLIVMVVALLLYGGDLPKVARSWGKTMAEFRKGLAGFQSELNEVMYDEPRRIPAPTAHYPRDDAKPSYPETYSAVEVTDDPAADSSATDTEATSPNPTGSA
jgi:sec-independent protein translocase protein TatA